MQLDFADFFTCYINNVKYWHVTKFVNKTFMHNTVYFFLVVVAAFALHLTD